MHHYMAFLGGINLGKRRIKMDQLRLLFEEMRFVDVHTFIASGNVIFATRTSDGSKLEGTIARHLQRSLGYEVKTFVRTRADVTAIATFPAFSVHELANPNNTFHVALMSESVNRAQAAALLACRTDVDEFCVNGREFYWLCRIRTSDSKVWSSPAMKQVRLPSSTMRNLTTMRKLATLYPAPAT